MDSEKTFIITTLTGREPVDIIRPASKTDRNMICDYLIKQRTGFDLIPEADAVKLLHQYGGIGVGCFIKDPTGTDTEWRRVESQLRYLDISKFVGMIQIEPSAELDCSILNMKPERPTLSISA